MAATTRSATVNLGRNAGMTVASALLVDYVLTVAVSISSAAQYAAGAIPALIGHEATAATVAVVVLAAMNLRGVRESGALLRGADLPASCSPSSACAPTA